MRIVDARQGTAIVLQVTDEGPGLRPDERERIFERFYKDPRSSGSGFGLAIARSLVAAHVGVITADGRAGAGTTITMTLPCP